jgi:hypothetical protein
MEDARIQLQKVGRVRVYQLGHGASGAICRFAGWVARGWVGHPMLGGIGCREELKNSPSQMEICFAIVAGVLELDDQGEPANDKYAGRCAGTWLYRYCTGEIPAGEADLEAWKCEPMGRTRSPRPGRGHVTRSTFPQEP